MTATDIKRLTGGPWRGTLTYLDYTKPVQTTIKSSLLMMRLPEHPDGAIAWEMSVGYADEPHANSGETVVTEQDGQDDGRAARLRFVHLLGEKQCSIQKLVRLLPDGMFFERHIYQWSR